jgi:hydroxymethylbilane synthase
LAQAEIVGHALYTRGVHAEMVIVSTAGDRRSPDTAWGEGAFVRAIEQALLDGTVDVAVHSAKDLPTDEDPRLRICGYLPRAEPRDALVLRHSNLGSLEDLPSGSVVGTDSPRRRGFLLARRPDLQVLSIHGNVDSRLRRLDAGEVDALVLAAAGLVRLGLGHRISQVLPVDLMPPAAGQGALAVQVRSDDTAASGLIAAVDHAPTRAAVEAERAALVATGGGCRAPVGVLAEVAGDRLTITGGFATLDGRATGVETVVGEAARALPLARELARRIVNGRARHAAGRRVMLTRPASDVPATCARLIALGVQPVLVPAIAIELLDKSPKLLEAVRQLPRFQWAAVTSANGVRAVRECADREGLSLVGLRWAAVGQRTARELRAAGITDTWVPSESSAAALAAGLPLEPGERVVWFAGSLADGTLDQILGSRGALVTRVLAYRTIEAPAASQEVLRQALAEGPIDAVVLASESAVRGLLALADAVGARADTLRIPVVCVGPRTASAARDAGFVVADVAPTQDAAVLGELAALVASK